ncbi:50S ribosomal protein L10 [Candidatus Omnitrophota bacterium]
MAKLSMECKKIMVEEISNRLNSAGALIVTNYKGLSSQDLNELRKELRSISSEYIVVKDSLVRRAFVDRPNSAITEFIEGDVGIAIDRRQDSMHVSKVLVKFSKDRKALKICAGIVNGEILSKEDISTIASLPSKEILLGKLANVLNAPIQGLASALSGIIAKLLYALNAVKDRKVDTEGQTAETKEPVEQKEEKPSSENKPAPKPEETKEPDAGDRASQDEGNKDNAENKKEKTPAENKENKSVEDVKPVTDAEEKKDDAKNKEQT